MAYSDYGFLDPIRIIWRTGTEEDPYTDRVEHLKVINQKVVLSEIPSKFDRVIIQGMQEVNYEKYHARELTQTTYAVDYATGIIQFSRDKEGDTVNLSYKGRGLIQYPSSRIFHQDQNNDVVMTLEQIIQKALNEFKNIEGKLNDYESLKLMLEDALQASQVSTDSANIATERADNATERALDAYETTRLVFKPYVQTYDDIMYNYPSPAIGWTTQVYDSGIRYRYDGNDWIPIDLFGGSILNASKTEDGLMSKESFQKLEHLGELPKEKVIVIVIPYLNIGANNVLVNFPYDGEIVDVRGICFKAGQDIATEIDIEKSLNMADWTSVFDGTDILKFQPLEIKDDGNKKMLIRSVVKDEVFRLNVKVLSGTIEGVTIEIIVNIDN